MALFSRKKEKKETEAAETKAVVKDEERKESPAPSALGPVSSDLPGILKQPRVTEKATELAERGVYVFEVLLGATKQDVFRAIEALYKVKPAKIHLVKIPSKKRQSKKRGVQGVKSRGKKAYVYLKKGQTIEVV